MNNIEKLKTTGLFTNYIYKAIPLAFDESMSYYETLLGLLNYLKNTVIPTVNNNADAVIELQNLYNELHDYVEHYFDNLDVQEEINNKLDEMAESGQLTDIIAQYLGLAGMITFDTVADMKVAENLVNGSKCYTLGYHLINDGGKAIYKVRTITNEDVVDEGSIIALYDNTLIAELVANDDITPEMFGAYGDGTHDDYQAFQNAINYLDGGNIKLQPKTYIIGDTLITHRGLKISGSSAYGEENSTLKLKNNTNKTLFSTPEGSGGLSTHYIILENLYFDGNKDNQTSEVDLIKFYGTFIGSIIRNVSIRNFYGTALALKTNDLQIDNLWINNGYTLTNKYAMSINQELSPTTINSMLNLSNIYIENYANSSDGNPRDNQSDRANGLLIYRVGSININEIHFEGCKTPITSSGPNVIYINMIRSAHCGLASDENNSFVYFQNLPRLVHISNMFSTINSVYNYWINRNFTSNDVPIVQKTSINDDLTLPLYITESSTQSKPNYLQKSYVSNQLFVNKIGAYSEPKIGIKTNDGTTYLKQVGTKTGIGTSINQSSDKNFIEFDSFGNNGDLITFGQPVRLATRESQANILSKSIYYYNSGTSQFPAYQKSVGSGVSRIATVINSSGPPTSNASYNGEMYLDYTNKKLYVATSTGSGVSDWTILN